MTDLTTSAPANARQVLDPQATLDRDKALTFAALAALRWYERDSADRSGSGSIVPQLMNAASWISRARRHHGMDPMRVSDVIHALHQSTDGWLPGDGNLLLLDDGQPTPACFEYAEGAESNAAEEVEQRIILEAMNNARDRSDPARVYTAFRRFLIENAWASHGNAAMALLPVRLGLGHVYEQIPEHAQFERQGQRVFYPCPRCRWPMRRSHSDQISCARSRPCLVAGARYCKHGEALLALGKYEPPLARPCEDHVALRPGVWRYTVLPGLEELDLRRLLEKIPGVEVQLWPDLDSYDLDVRLDQTRWRVDVKDQASAPRLARALMQRHAREQGRAREQTWIVVPDRRRDQVPVLERLVPQEAHHVFTYSSDFIRQVREAAQ